MLDELKRCFESNPECRPTAAELLKAVSREIKWQPHERVCTAHSPRATGRRASMPDLTEELHASSSGTVYSPEQLKLLCEHFKREYDRACEAGDVNLAVNMARTLSSLEKQLVEVRPSTP